MVLGRVSQINRYDMALDLPNNLVGYVPITAISTKITERIEALASEEDTEGSENESKRLPDINLHDFFLLGDYLRAYVVSTEGSSTSGERPKKHIELSLRPEHANAGLRAGDVVVHSMVQAEVHSVEDHGLVANVGIAESSVRGFISSRELGSGRKISQIQAGTVFMC